MSDKKDLIKNEKEMVEKSRPIPTVVPVGMGERIYRFLLPPALS